MRLTKIAYHDYICCVEIKRTFFLTLRRHRAFVTPSINVRNHFFRNLLTKRKKNIDRYLGTYISSTVEPRNSVKFGHPDFLRYCGVFRYLAGSSSQPKKHNLEIYSQYTRLCTFSLIFSLLISKTRTHII